MHAAMRERGVNCPGTMPDHHPDDAGDIQRNGTARRPTVNIDELKQVLAPLANRKYSHVRGGDRTPGPGRQRTTPRTSRRAGRADAPARRERGVNLTGGMPERCGGYPAYRRRTVADMIAHRPLTESPRCLTIRRKMRGIFGVPASSPTASAATSEATGTAPSSPTRCTESTTTRGSGPARRHEAHNDEAPMRLLAPDPEAVARAQARKRRWRAHDGPIRPAGKTEAATSRRISRPDVGNRNGIGGYQKPDAANTPC